MSNLTLAAVAIAGALDVNQTGELLLDQDTVNANTLTLNEVNMFFHRARVDLENGSTLQVNGDMSNAGAIIAGAVGGGNTMRVNGTITNEYFGNIYLSGSSAIYVGGDVTNIHGGFGSGGAGGNTISVGGRLYNEAMSGFSVYGPGDTATFGSIDNSGRSVVSVTGGSSLHVSGDVNNRSGNITLGWEGSSGNTIWVDGTLNNQEGSVLGVYGPQNAATIGKLVNTEYSSVVVGPGARVTTSNLLTTASLEIDISGSHDFGVIDVNGPVALSGYLIGNVEDHFGASDGELFKFLTFAPGELTGTFTNVEGNQKWSVIYDNADGYVELESLNPVLCRNLNSPAILAVRLY